MRHYILVGIILFSSGCAVADDPGSSGFLNSSNMSEQGYLPFEQSWIRPLTDFGKYKWAFVAPVNTSYVKESGWWQEMDRSGEIQGDIDKLAKYTQAALQRAILLDPKKRFLLSYSTRPAPDVLRIEMALTELTPNKVLLKAAGFIPFYGLAASALNATNPSYVSMEIRLTDGKTGEVLAKFADRKSEPFTLVNVNQLTWYGFAEKRIDQWSEKLVETLNRKPGEVVESSSNFELKPW